MLKTNNFGWKMADCELEDFKTLINTIDTDLAINTILDLPVVNPGFSADSLRTTAKSEDWGYTTAGGFWSGNAQASGTNNQPTATSKNHPGIVQARSHASNANSGYGTQTGSSQLLIGGGEDTNFVFRIDLTTGTRTIMGWFTAYTAPTDPASLLFIDIQGTTLRGMTSKATVQTVTSTTYTITQGVWYRGRITVSDDANSATFRLYTDAGKLVWANTVVGNIPIAALLHGWATSQTSSSGVTILSSFDYQDIRTGLGLQRGYPTFPIIGYGDSHTFNSTYNVVGQYYPALLQRTLNAYKGVDTYSYNYGVSGASTSYLIGTLAQGYADKDPAISIIYCGTNDTNAGHFGTVQASPAPTATGCTLEAGIPATMAIGSYIHVGSNLVKITDIVVNAITWTPAIAVPSAGVSVTPATKENLELAVDMLRAANCNKIIIVGQHYLNFATGGDTVTTEYSGSGGSALRAIQKAAALEKSVPFLDTYKIGKEAIQSGVYTQGTDTVWHVGVGNSHLNALGQKVLLGDPLNYLIVSLNWHLDLIPA